MSALSIRRRLLQFGLLQGCLYTGSPLTANHRRLRLQWAHQHRAWQAFWHQVAFSDESRFNLWDHDGRIRVRRHSGERCLLECDIERHSGTPNPSHAIFQQINDCPHVAKTVRDFFSTQHMQLLLWPAYSPDMSPIEPMWNLVGWRLARDPSSAASKHELFQHIQAIWNSLPQADFQNLFDTMPCRIAALIAARGGYTKY
ncbi:transposable element Tcb1 transposase [Trichonephila clavipes]|uniref:Transposable element Tcb1 transposase n=1 Tax=Trichonephila clavipes TaxID=2585209 RepID=A0A8X6RF37_TRICX|nr:transposable element Tcb1 transposase [Trichonephila clavipes]